MEGPPLLFSRLTQRSEKLSLSYLSSQNLKDKPLNQSHSSFFGIIFSFQSSWLLCYHVLLGPLLIIFLSPLNQAQDRQRARVQRAYVEVNGSRSLARSRCLGWCVTASQLPLWWRDNDEGVFHLMGTQVRRIISREPISNTWQEITSEMEVSKTLEHSEICQYFWSVLIKKTR